jgi:hypothetical protein
MCGRVVPTAHSAWGAICVNPDCDGLHHRWVDLTTEQGDD